MTFLNQIGHGQAIVTETGCQRNHKACPVLEVCDPGDPEPKGLAPGADLRYDLPRYAVYREGERLPDVTDLGALWRPDLQQPKRSQNGSWNVRYRNDVKRAGVTRVQELVAAHAPWLRIRYAF